MHLGNICAFGYFDAHDSAKFEKITELPWNKSYFFDRSNGTLDNHELREIACLFLNSRNHPQTMY